MSAEVREDPDQGLMEEEGMAEEDTVVQDLPEEDTDQDQSLIVDLVT
jgi:hypothetical protein